MEQILSFIQTLGFPIAVAVAISLFTYRFIVRVMDENQKREEGYKSLLEEYGIKIGEISKTLSAIQERLDKSWQHKHKYKVFCGYNDMKKFFVE